MTAALSQWKIFLQFMANLCDGNTGNRCNLSSSGYIYKCTFNTGIGWCYGV